MPEIICAEPIESQAQAFARFAESAADGLFTQMLGGDAEVILAKLYLLPRHDNSYQNVHFLQAEGQLAGMLSAYSGAQAKSWEWRSLGLWVRIATWRMIKMSLVSIVLAPIFNFMSQMEPDDFYLQMVAVDAEFRGRGLSKLILGHAEVLAKQADCPRLSLDVDSKNTIAISAYQRVGFTIEKESPTVNSDGEAIQLYRMVKPL